MSTRLIAIILTCCITLPAWFTDPARAGDGAGTRLLLAQADTGAAKRRSRAPLPPLPPAKNAIATEKDVPGIPGEPKPLPAPPEPEPEPEVPAADAQPEQTQQTQQPVATTEPSATAEQSAAVTTPGVPIPTPPGAAIATPSVTGAATAIAGAASAAATMISAAADSTSPAQAQPVPAQQTTAQPAPVPPIIAAPKEISTVFSEELSIFNVPSGNLRTMKLVIDDDFNLRGMVYGEEQGYIRILEANNDGEFDEVWKSPILNSPVRGLFVEDLEGDGDAEIVVYTADGTLFIYDYLSRDQIYRTPEGLYAAITCMIVENLDNDPQKEIFFLASRSGGGGEGEVAGNLIQFDPVNQFEEWSSSETYTATDMVFGNVDTDDEPEIILNTGEVLSLRFKNAEWKSSTAFGSRLYLIDLDDDGIMELVSEYDQSYMRVFDIDQRREKW